MSRVRPARAQSAGYRTARRAAQWWARWWRDYVRYATVDAERCSMHAWLRRSAA